MLSLLPLLVTILHTLSLPKIGVFEQLDALIYDARMRWTMPQTLDPRIVIVDIDEKSLAEIGRWPWSRHKMAQLTNLLFEQQQVALIGFDVVFAESDESSGLTHLQRLAKLDFHDDPGFSARLAQIAPSLDYDALFAKALSQRPIVLGYYFTTDQAGQKHGVLPNPVMQQADRAAQHSDLPDWTGFGANISQLTKAASMAGFFNSFTESDGVVRALPLLARFNGNYYESLYLALFRQFTGMPSVTTDAHSATQSASEQIVLRWPGQTFSIPADPRMAMLITYRGHGGVHANSFQYISASDLLAGRVPTDQLKGKIILIGTTAPGIVDLRVSPIDAVYPGIEVQANALSNLLDRQFLQRPAHATSYEFVLLLAIGLTLSLLLPLISAPTAVASSIPVLAALMTFNSWLYVAHGLVLQVAALLIAVIGIYALNIAYGYLAASRSRRELIQLFGTYVPPELVREMIKDPGHYTMRARSDELTVMFCDMRGFTSLAERLSPEDLQRFLNQVFSELTRLIGANRGTVDKYMGDCVMAFWGAPVESPTHAQLAVKAALQMADALERINQTHQSGSLAHHQLKIELGIGLNTGQMYVGDMGSDIRRSYTVIGDAVNLGSRLEGLSKIYGVSIVASESTRQLASNFIWQELDRVRVKGKEQAITIFAPIAEMPLPPTPISQELKLWETFLTIYRSQNWQQSAELIDQLLQINNKKNLYKLYQQRIVEKKTQSFDPLWDGATNFESK